MTSQLISGIPPRGSGRVRREVRSSRVFCRTSGNTTRLFRNAYATYTKVEAPSRYGIAVYSAKVAADLRAPHLARIVCGHHAGIPSGVKITSDFAEPGFVESF